MEQKDPDQVEEKDVADDRLLCLLLHGLQIRRIARKDLFQHGVEIGFLQKADEVIPFLFLRIHKARERQNLVIPEPSARIHKVLRKVRVHLVQGD